MTTKLASCRSTFIFGNGLGMALDPGRFGLTQIVESAMSDPLYALSADKLSLIKSCIEADSAGNAGFSESHLKTAQRFMVEHFSASLRLIGNLAKIVLRKSK